MKKISIVTPCYNEEDNVEELHRQVQRIFDRLGTYDYEHLFIDNASKDRTVKVLKEIAKEDPRVKIIVNYRNFGPVRSLFHALLQTDGDAAVFLVADLQDPPELILDFIKKWEEGYKVVKAIKISSKESSFFYFLRSVYYKLINTIADIELSSHFTGFGLYDKQVIETLRSIGDPYPYFRGLIEELGFESARIEYQQERRKRGISSYNFYRYYDEAMLGITSHSIVPLRLATMLGFFLGMLSFAIAVVTLIMKLLFWNYFPVGVAALIIGSFFMFSMLLFFIGILGEYIGLINRRILKRPLVVERERVNFK